MEQNKKHIYGFLDNYHYVYSRIWKKDKSIIGFGFMEVIVCIIQPLVLSSLPAAAIALIERRLGIGKLLLADY